MTASGSQPLLSSLEARASPARSETAQDSSPPRHSSASAAAEMDDGEYDGDGGTDGGGRGGGNNSEAESGAQSGGIEQDKPAACRREPAGYSSDHAGALPRLPRASHHAPVRSTNFSGSSNRAGSSTGSGAAGSGSSGMQRPTTRITRVCAPNQRNSSSERYARANAGARRGGTSTASQRLRAVEDADEDCDWEPMHTAPSSRVRQHAAAPMAAADPLVWTGTSPRPQPFLVPADSEQPTTSFSLPPLLAETTNGTGGMLGGRERTGMGGNGLTSPSYPPHARVLRCSSYCVALSINLRHLYRALAAYGRPCAEYKDGLNYVLHCQEASNGQTGEAHSFFFSYGCVVTWGLSEQQELERLQLLSSSGCAIEPLEKREGDDFGYTHVPGCKPAFVKDVVTLATVDVREKLAVSFALAQSVKLGVYEEVVEQTIQETREIPERMAQTGIIRQKRKTLTKRIGQLFVDRASINLHSDILDHPDFFWEDDEWLPLYLRASKYLEIDRRAEVLNKRLDIIKELYDMLANELNVSHSNKLEWIIIVLIVLEVLFQILALVMDSIDKLPHLWEGLLGGGAED